MSNQYMPNQYMGNQYQFFAHDNQIQHVMTTGTMEDMEPASKTLSSGDKEAVFLQVIDAPFNGMAPQLRGVFSSNDDIAERMQSIPEHMPGTARILDVTIHSDFIITGLRDTKGPETTRRARHSMIQFLKYTYTPRFDPRRIFRWLNDPLLVNDIGSISSQWSQRLGDGETHFYRLVNRTSLQQDPLDYDLHPRDSYLTCAQDEYNRLVGKCAKLCLSAPYFPSLSLTHHQSS